jgi:sugar O-acyltransferase (sialic acid O-acetyltransferase NeuD family)
VSRVIVIGGAGQGRQVIDAIEAAGVHVVVGVLDRAFERGSKLGGYLVLGADGDLAACAAPVGADAFVVAIGDNFARGTVQERESTANPGLEACTVVHPAAVIARDASIDIGSIVLAGAVVSNGCRVGRGALIGTNASLDHDNVVGDYASLAPAATTGGGVSIGAYTAIGLGANVIHGITIGDHTVIGAGALVLGDVPARVVAYGIPARVARPRASGDPYL